MDAAGKALVREIASELGRKVEDKIASRREDPELWFKFHDHMLKSLPRWRRIARAYHRLMRRRMQGFMEADNA